MPRKIVMAAALALMPALALAGDVKILKAEARAGSSGWSFAVTLEHGDTGWDHYADAWRVVAPDGAVLGTRTLYHPHVEEQPFTRSLAGVAVPEGVDRVFIEAHDSVHGWSPQRLEVALPR